MSNDGGASRQNTLSHYYRRHAEYAEFAVMTLTLIDIWRMASVHWY